MKAMPTFALAFVIVLQALPARSAAPHSDLVLWYD